MQPTRRHWSDWAGAAAFCGLFALAVSRGTTWVLAPVLLKDLFGAAAFLLRRPLRRAPSGLYARVVGYGHFALVFGFMEGAALLHPEWLDTNPHYLTATVGQMLYLVGFGLAAFPLYQLRGSFSIEPQARELVTGGLYGFARHPIYSFYLLGMVGLALWRSTPAMVTVCVLWAVVMVLRIREEERVLSAQFPEYEAYRARVGMLGPRLPRPVPALAR
ncbi:MAG TPA: isoprenylcysteine carboxylmethyltransferase family protein [Longimicrobiaceae bacterium]